MSQAKACQTTGHLNSLSLPTGAIVLFNGGDTFGGGTTGVVLTTTVTPGPITIGSYGTGQATISTGNSAACVTATNVPSVTINNIICTGGGNTTNTTDGISIINSQAGNTTLAGPTITNSTVSAYGGSGIVIHGTNGSSGFGNVTINSNTVHDVTGELATDDAGILVYAASGLAAHSNVVINSNTVYNANGTANGGTGFGIAILNSAGVTAQYNVIHDFGANNNFSSGPVGLWSTSTSNTLFQFNEVYNGKTANVDGDGIDCDGAVATCLIQYNYTHNNVGAGILIFAYTGSTTTNIIARFNISQNDASNIANAGGIQVAAAGTGSISGCQVYNNTVYTNVGSAFGSVGAGAGVTCQISNNIFYGLLLNGNVIEVAAGSNLSFTNNDYYGNPTFFWNGTTYSTFGAWQTATGQEKIGGVNVGLTKEPRLVVYGGGGNLGGYLPANLNEYQLQAGSPMLNAGLNLTTQYGYTLPATDFYGVAITAATLPIGAGQQVAWTSGATTSCSQYTTFLARMSSPPVATQQQTNALLCGMVADGYLATLDAFYKLATDSATDALLNLISTSFAPTTSGTITFTANQGYASNGTNGYLDTHYKPSTAAGNLTINSAEIGAYDITNNTSAQSAWEIVAGDGANTTGFCLFCSVGSAASKFAGWTNELNIGGYLSGSAMTTSRGLFISQRTAVGSEAAYQNSAQLTTSSSASSALPTTDITIGGVGGVGFYTTDTIAYAWWGSKLTAQQIVYLSFRVNADAIALGINAF